MNPIAQVWTFASSSGRGTYETLQYADATTSCNCPGWTRRTTSDGSRSCRHTRLVDMNRANNECESHHDYTLQVATPRPPGSTSPATNSIGFQGRKLVL